MSVEQHDEPRVVSPIELTDRIALFGSPRMYVPLIGIVVALIAGLVWAGATKAPVSVPAEGVISTTDGPLSVSTSVAGTVKAIYVQYGETVQQGNNIAVIEDDKGVVTRVQSPIAGTVIEISTKVGNFADSGSHLVTLQNDRLALRAIALVPVESVGAVQVGQQVLVSPSSVPSGDYGYIYGRVVAVGQVPMSQERIDELIGAIAGTAQPTAQTSPVVEVQIELQTDASTTSGFAWTIASGPPFQLLGSTPWAGEIIISQQSWLSQLFG